ncbi:N-acyl homoserine lactonase family protein [Streptomyces sp. ISL-43]|uniref:N-acyl homoserine lactonase family protein n=1 Tax=Streptomyces sp. ISL-43 TaxID=2819183 RepID=UPI001BE699C7|nr:N-acyl homoserine lactonase family protein [Streptomyces sp. ISL-43]MBT2447876.1 N-acyl homoserine lactonase family protein [Streptomyces sp. ISL-43]
MRLYLLRLGVIAGLEAPVPGYLIRTDDGVNVLVDTGAPVDPSPDARIKVAAGQDVVTTLAALGLGSDDISYVVCSHLDPDHAGFHASFPGAEFVIQREHYELARSGTDPRLTASSGLWDLPGLNYRTVEGDTELLPGIELLESGGHVPGHQSVLVRLPETGPVLLAVDAIPMAIAMDPDNRPVFPFDQDEKSVRESTRKLVAIAREENALIVHGHDAKQWESLRVAPEYYA